MPLETHKKENQRSQSMEIFHTSTLALMSTTNSQYCLVALLVVSSLAAASGLVSTTITRRRKGATGMYHHFEDFQTAKTVTRKSVDPAILKASEMVTLTKVIYKEAPLPLRHELVATGITQDIAWMITDSDGHEYEYLEKDQQFNRSTKQPASLKVCTITLRGFDAGDKSTNRELLLNKVFTSTPENMDGEIGVLAHSGLLSIARVIYKDVISPHIHKAGPNVKFVLNGHSIGGSLSVLILLLLTREHGGKHRHSMQ